MEVNSVIYGFHGADLFHDWDSEDIEQYNELRSIQMYAELVEKALKAEYPNAEIDVRFDTAAMGVLPMSLHTRINHIDAESADDTVMAELGFIEDITTTVFMDHEWLVPK